MLYKCRMLECDDIQIVQIMAYCCLTNPTRRFPTIAMTWSEGFGLEERNLKGVFWIRGERWQ